MASKLHKNAVITGHLDSFCLVCEYFLRSEREAITHIEKPLHQKKLAMVPYFDKFRDDNIRKVKMGYYCEFCNILIPIASKVALHIVEDDHKHNKGTLLLKLRGSEVIAFNDIVINNKSWHGIIDDVCVVCNVEFDDESVHRSTDTHILRLVQNSVQFGPNNAIYRQVDNSTMQCLTCEIVIASNTMTDHFNDSKHLCLYEKCKRTNLENDHNNVNDSIQNGANNSNKKSNDGEHDEEKTRIKEAETIGKTTKTNQVKPTKDMKSKIVESVTEYQKNAININLENETAFCKKCLVNIEFDNNDVENHISNHSTVKNVNSELIYPSENYQDLNRLDIKVEKDAWELSSPEDGSHTGNTELKSLTEDSPDVPNDDEQASSLDENPASFAKANNITYNDNNKIAYCRMCEKRFPSCLFNMKEHVMGVGHKNNVERERLAKLNVPKERMKRFVRESLTATTNLFENDVIVNETYCMTLFSFLMVTKVGQAMRCQACEVNLTQYDHDGRLHAQMSTHQVAMSETPVVTSDSTEFIREVRPGVFHCGYCNMVTGSWPETTSHVQCSEHAEAKTFCKTRLQAHLPAIRHYKMTEFAKRVDSLWGDSFF